MDASKIRVQLLCTLDGMKEQDGRVRLSSINMEAGHFASRIGADRKSVKDMFVKLCLEIAVKIIDDIAPDGKVIEEPSADETLQLGQTLMPPQ